ncbi:hypothetical protein B566_EDAN003955 [Ephemera danica]|nr:hypothetical protein B566_EDAN003955 [Ephemera danica]
MTDGDDNLTRQADEIEALSSIYDTAFKIEDEANRSYSILIGEVPNTVTLFFKFSEGYPSMVPPTYQLSAPWLKGIERHELSNHLENLYLDHIGDTTIFQWAEKLRELLQARSVNPEIEDIPPAITVPAFEEEESSNAVDFVHGEVIVNRKSSFQAHVTSVSSNDDVKKALKSLLSNRKIAGATHNIYAYRIDRGGGCFIQDCEDDGETQAGGRLLHLLQILGVSGILVVVSRWYGGIHLGPDRFRHISNAAKQVLQQAQLLPPSTKTSKSS